MDNTPVKIVQISDTHLYSDPQKDLLGVNTDVSFHKVLSLVKKNELNNLNMILLTGDIAQDFSDNAYIRVAEALSTLQLPIYTIPGNHDDIAIMKRIYPHKTVSYQNQVLLKHWNLIFLNSHLSGTPAGYLEKNELDMMESSLEKNKNKHTMIVLHHQPISVGSKWLDNLGLRNADEFWKIVDCYPQIKLILYGHIHQQHETTRKGIPCLGTPSTCIQFMGKVDDFKLEDIPPGYRWLELYADGKFNSGIKRVPEYVGYYDADATGY